MINKRQTPKTPVEAAQMLIDDPTFMTLGDRYGVQVGVMRLKIPDTFRIIPIKQPVISGMLNGGFPLIWSSTERDLLVATEALNGKVYAKVHWPCRLRSRHTVAVFEHETTMLFQPFIGKPVLRVAMGLKAWSGMK